MAERTALAFITTSLNDIPNGSDGELMKALMTFIISAMFISGCASKPAAAPEHTEYPATTAPSENVTTEAKEWKGACRKNTNEAGKEIKGAKFKRLQSSYVFNGQEAVWYVRTYTDSQCKNIFGGNKYTFKCDGDPATKSTKCIQHFSSSWKNNAWTSDKATKAADQLIMQYFFKVGSNNKATLKLRSVSDDGAEEKQTLTL